MWHESSVRSPRRECSAVTLELDQVFTFGEWTKQLLVTTICCHMDIGRQLQAVYSESFGI